MRNRALIVVDVQRDFCEGGALAVTGGNAVAEKIRNWATTFNLEYSRIVFTADDHNHWPDTNGGHSSLTPDFETSWPIHCQSGTSGAEFHSDILKLQEKLHTNPNSDIFYKGQGKPDYSGFQGYNKNFYSLGRSLVRSGVSEVDICGIAGDYCVKETALDAVRAGLNVVILPDKVASVGGTAATIAMVEAIDAERELLVQ